MENEDCMNIKGDRDFSRADLTLLLETAHLIFMDDKQKALDTAIQKLHGLIAFESGFLVRTRVEADQIKQGYMCWGFGESTIQEYFKRGYPNIDPVAEALYQNRKFINIENFFKQLPAANADPVYRLISDHQLNPGVADIIGDNRNEQMTTLVLYRILSRIDRRIEMIMHYLLPFFSILYEDAGSNGHSAKKSVHLTDKEKEVLKWLKEGKTSWEISMILDISERTVNFHVANLMHKLNATKRTQAVAVALKAGVIEF